MSQVVNLLEVFWAAQRVDADSILTYDEKQIVKKELLASLPHPLHSNTSQATRGIVESYLSPTLPSIPKDEVPVDKINARKTVLPKRYNKK